MSEEMRRKIKKEMEENGLEPFKLNYSKDEDLRKIVKEKEEGEIEFNQENLSTTGRVRKIEAGSETTIILQDQEKKLAGITTNEETEEYIAKYVQEGDIVGIRGKLDVEDELIIEMEEISLLTKAIKPPSREPNEEVSDSLEFIKGNKILSDFKTRSQIINLFRDYLREKGFTEVETPIIKNRYDGTNEEPFRTKIRDIDEEGFLRIAKELHLKRLIVGGFDKIFEIGKDFRNEEIDSTHNPEFTEIELYQTYTDYEDMMELTEKMIEHIVRETIDDVIVEYQGNKIDFSTSWERLTIREAIEKHAGFDVDELTDKEIKEKLESRNIELDSEYERGLAIAELFEEFAEENLVQPTHIIDFPTETTPLCRKHREKEGRIERFETFVAGMEIANSYTELRDPIELEKRHHNVEKRQDNSDDEEAYQVDRNFLESMKLGMPPTGGLGIGIDRLVMIITDSQSLRDVIAFPMRK